MTARSMTISEKKWDLMMSLGRILGVLVLAWMILEHSAESFDETEIHALAELTGAWTGAEAASKMDWKKIFSSIFSVLRALFTKIVDFFRRKKSRG